MDLKNSEQQLVECSTAPPIGGCIGGWEHEAWQYLASCGGQTFESSYPYTASDGANCRFNIKDMTIGAKLSTLNYVEWVPENDISTMMSILSSGRILTVYIRLPDSFMNYK